MNSSKFSILILILTLFQLIYIARLYDSSYFPSLIPQNYCKKSESSKSCISDVTLYVNRLTTEESNIRYDYDHFDFCTTDKSNSLVENLEQVIFGQRMKPSPYKISFMENATCQKLCQKSYTGGDADSERRLMKMKKGMSLDYQHHWIVDDIPVKWCYPLQNDREYCSTGLSMGCLVRNSINPHAKESCPLNLAFNRPATYYLFNHVDLVITYQSGTEEEWGNAFKQYGGRITSVKVTPSSIRHEGNSVDCSSQTPLEIPSAPLEQGKKIDVTYTYSVKLLTLISAIAAVQLECEYQTQSFKYSEDLLRCFVKNNGVYDGSRVTFVSVVESDVNADDVKAFYMYQIPNVNYFPKNIDGIFNNIEELAIEAVNLKKIKQSDLKNFRKLKQLYLSFNQLSHIEENLFEFNPYLEVISMENSGIKNIDVKAFSDVFNLRLLALKDNNCVTKVLDSYNNREDVQMAIQLIENGACSSKVLKNVLTTHGNFEEEKIKWTYEKNQMIYIQGVLIAKMEEQKEEIRKCEKEKAEINRETAN